jgi:hypothetical protein
VGVASCTLWGVLPCPFTPVPPLQLVPWSKLVAQVVGRPDVGLDSPIQVLVGPGLVRDAPRLARSAQSSWRFGHC